MSPAWLAEWESSCARFVAARAARRGRFEGPDAARASATAERSLCAAAAPLLAQVDAGGCAVVERTLEDPSGCWFVAGLLEQSPTIPAVLFPMLVRAAIRIGDPSWNRAFIDPCVRVFGARETTTAILGYLEAGSSDEKLSAAAALYWIRTHVASLTFGPNARGSSWEDATAESRAIYTSFADVRRQVGHALLRAFIANDDPAFRRLLADYLYVPGKAEWSEEMTATIAEARRIGQMHPDEATRAVVARKLGSI